MSAPAYSLVRETPPEAFRLSVRQDPGSKSGQYQIENEHFRLENWDREYVSFGGFFGIHNPALFAAAPDLLDVARTLRDYVADAAGGTLTYDGSGDGFTAMAKEDLARLDAAIALATGENTRG